MNILVLDATRWRSHTALGIAGAAAAMMLVAGAVWLLRRFRRPGPAEVERARRLHIHAIGRVTNGEILEMMAAPDAPGLAPTLVYQYEVGGVTYQVSQALHLVPVELDPGSWIPGWPVQVKFDPANPGNSIVACEHWKGLVSRPRP
ncbi:MAG TPA: DUF3592 domain-containing protein [Terriglobales bacterium]|nr:DUF3592 domain-containing protein [Terriglobales bacterium]